MSEPLSNASSDQHDVALSDVMLAMDVVDMLRHEDKIVARAMNETAREQALIERVKKAYAAQGIAVSDEMIANGVAALKEQEYAYEPAPPGLKSRLLMAWINRRRITGGLGVVAALATLIAGGWYGFVEYPEKREREALASELSNAVIAGKSDIDLLLERRARLEKQWQTVSKQRPENELALAFDQMGSRIESGLATAERQLAAGISAAPVSGITADTVATRESFTREKLNLQRQYISASKRALSDVEQALTDIEQLEQLPATLALLRDEATDLAIPASIDADIERDYQAANGALRRGDPATALATSNALRTLITSLETEYRIRIVSRPGELSGVIREPPNNARASNYYLIVEARDENNNPVQVSVQSEEDGSVATVSRWGIRVDEATFDRIRRDKQDDGIIQASSAGEKRRGYLDIAYSLPTTGGKIHRWEAPR
ncbi:MAG: DUF6384 family protein [Pseudomonadota bacterium]